MSSKLIIAVILIYFFVLIAIAKLTAKKADNKTFFLGERKSPWYIVAFGMIGASLSGVTFLSVPAWVGNSGNQFSYMQAVLGYFFGYIIVATVLIPLYYKMNLTSIYEYLKQRFGFWSYKTGAFFFLGSRILGASVRLLLVANVLQLILFDRWNIPYFMTVIVAVALIWIYTNKGGIKTIIWTDTLQTAFMLASVFLTIYMLSNLLDLPSEGGVYTTIKNSSYSKIFFFEDSNSSNYFLKHFFGGVFITIGMTGLDQDMMQKNLSCKNSKEAQKNIMSMATILILVNLVFLSLGALLYMYANKTGVGLDAKSDMLFAKIAMDDSTGTTIGILFLLGVIAAAYSSADSALTSLTTSFSIDFLNLEKMEQKKAEKTRKTVHIFMSIAIVLMVLLLKYGTDESAIGLLMKMAGFTYGPLIGLFFFGILTQRKLNDKLVPLISLLVPLIIGILWNYSTGAPGIPKGELGIFGAYKFGFEIIIYNALLSYVGLYLISKANLK